MNNICIGLTEKLRVALQHQQSENMKATNKHGCSSIISIDITHYFYTDISMYHISLLEASYIVIVRIILFLNLT